MARPKGPKEWTPRRIPQALKDLEKRTVDSTRFRDGDESKLMCVAYPNPPRLEAVHVTDDPGVMAAFLRSGGDLQERRPWGDLCGGLYVSDCPDFWKVRSRRKWDFMESLTPRQARALADLVVEDLWEKADRGYITESEHERGRRSIEHHWLVRGNWHAALSVADQPYNVDFQKLAREGGIADPFKPHYVRVEFTGRYVEMMDREAWEAATLLAQEAFMVSEGMMTREDQCRALRFHGWNGAFTRSHMTTNPELVIWDAERVLRFGDYVRS